MADDEQRKPDLRDRLYAKKRAENPDLPSNDPEIEAQIATPTSSSQQKQLMVWVPDYVHKQLRQKGASEGCTNRYLVLEALQKIGIVVSDADREKDRR